MTGSLEPVLLFSYWGPQLVLLLSAPIAPVRPLVRSALASRPKNDGGQYLDRSGMSGVPSP